MINSGKKYEPRYEHVEDPSTIFRDYFNEVFKNEINGKFYDYFLNSGNDFLQKLIDKTRVAPSLLFDWYAIEEFDRWEFGEEKFKWEDNGYGNEKVLHIFEMSCNIFRRKGDEAKVFRLYVQRDPNDMPKIYPKYDGIETTDPLPTLGPMFPDRAYYILLQYDGELVLNFRLLIPGFSAKLNYIVLKKGGIKIDSIWSKRDLKEWQNRLGYSYEEAADVLGISRATFANYLRRNEPIPVAVASACILFEMYYLKNYRVSLDEMLKRFSSDDD